MYCTFCGAKVSDDDLYCPECGHKLWHADTNENHQAKADWIRLVSDFANSSGDRKTAAFEKLYAASYKAIYASVQRYAQNPQESEDAVQNAFIICYDKINQLDNAANFIPWMKQIAYNEFLKSVRKTNKETLLTPITDDEGNETDAFDLTEDDTIPLPEDAYSNAELQDLLLDAINSLSEIQRITVKGFYFDQKKISDLASDLGIPINSVKTNLSRGRKNLERKVQAYANAYGLKLVPLAAIPFFAILAKKDVLAAEATAVGGSVLLAAIEKAIGIKAASGISAGIGTAASSTETTVTTGAVSSVASSSATGSAAASTATAVGTHAAAGTSVAVKIGIGITAAAVATGGVGAYVHNRNTDTQQVAAESSTVQETTHEELEAATESSESVSMVTEAETDGLTIEQLNYILLQWDNGQWTNDTYGFAYEISSAITGNLASSVDYYENIALQYDSQGKLSSETVTNGGAGVEEETFEFTYTYNDMGMLATEKGDDFGRYANYQYDVKYDYQYDNSNHVIYCAGNYGNSDTDYECNYSYDDAGRLISLTSHTSNGNANEPDLDEKRTFVYNDQNELVKMEEYANGEGGVRSSTNTYHYKLDGTISSIDEETVTPIENERALTSYSHWEFTYDDSGKLIKGEHTEDDNSETVTYTYSDTAEANTEEAVSSSEMLDVAFSQDVDVVYGGVAEDDLSSSYWMQNMGDDTSPFYIIQTGNYQGSNGVIAEFKKDLDGDGQNELLVFFRHKTTQSRHLSNNSTEGADSFNVWTVNMVVYDAENGRVSHSDPMEISTIGNINDNETDTEILSDAYGLVVYTKGTNTGNEILCLSYGTSYLNADGTGETFTAYGYNGKEITVIGSVDFAGSDAYGIGEDTEFIGKLRAMGLEKSADQIQGTDNFLSENTESHGKVGYYFGIVASDEENITNEFELYTTSNLDTEAWTSATINGTIGSFDASGYTSTIKSVVYDGIE